MVLNIEESIQKLRQYRNVSFPIFSVYLQIPPGEKARNKKLRNQFQALVDREIKQADKALYQQDLNYIAAFLNEYKHTGNYRGIAIFSGGNKLWEIVTTRNQLSSMLSVSHSSDLKPLMQTLNNYRRYLVVLADREKARYFTMHMGVVESQGGVEDPNVPQKVKGRNMAELSGKIDRHIRNHLNQHMQFIGGKVHEFVRNKQITGVIIGGHKEQFNNLKEHLPKELQQKIVGEFISELNTSMNAIIAESKKVIEQVNNNLNQKQRFHPA